MTTTAKLLFVLASASVVGVGCATAPEGGGDTGGGGAGGGGGGGGGDGGGSGGGGAQPLDATGSYGMQSTFDLSSNMPGAVGDVVNQFIDATDGPNDPTQWLMDLIIQQISNSTIKSLLSAGEPLVVGYLNQQVLSWAPDFVTTFVRIGNDFGDMAKHTGLSSTLAVTKSGSGYTSVHTVTGARFVVEGTAKDFAFKDYGVQNVVVPDVAVTCDLSGNFGLAEQQVPVAYGAVLHMGLDGAIIPLVDSNAADLQTLLADKIDCAVVGQDIADKIGIGDASLYAGACTAGLNAGAAYIYSKIDGIDSSVMQFDMSGAATASDTTGDGKVDTIAAGAWSGTLSYAGTPAPLSTATFTGARQ